MSSGPELPANHGWVHRPKAQGGTDPIEAAAFIPDYVVFHTETAQAIATGTSMKTVAWNTAGAGYWASSDDFATAGNSYLAHDAGDTTTNFMWVYRTGLYVVGCTVVWETGNYAKETRLRRANADGGGGPTGSSEGFFGWTDASGNYDAPNANTMLPQNPVDTAQSTVHKDVEWWDVRFVDDAMFLVQVRQTSGSSKNVIGAKLSIIRVAEALAF